MDIEEEDGYLAVVAQAKPNLQNQIDLLAGDHDRFRFRIRELLPQLENLHEWQEGDFQEVCDEIRLLLEEVDHHDQQEIFLIQESLLCDEGGEG